MVHKSPHFFGLGIQQAATRMGHLRQCARIDSLTYNEGPERGSRLMRLTSGGGLNVDILPDRALDIAQLEVCGIPLAWLSPTGMAHPAMVDASGNNFLRTFGGGFLATCGLDHFGPPCEDEGRAFPQHGRVGGLPAIVTRAEVDVDGLHVTGEIVQASVHGEHLQLRREIFVPLGSTTIEIYDTVTNLGSDQQPHMVLYHCNFGWPLLHEDARITVPATHVMPATPWAEKEPWDHLSSPQQGMKERVYLHQLKPGKVSVHLDNPNLGLGLKMSFDSAQLPGLCQWKMLGEKQYVLGLEPTNTLHLGGRAKARDAKELKFLAPGASASYHIRFDVLGL